MMWKDQQRLRELEFREKARRSAIFLGKERRAVAKKSSFGRQRAIKSSGNSIYNEMKSILKLEHLRKGEVMHGIPVVVNVAEVGSFRGVHRRRRHLLQTPIFQRNRRKFFFYYCFFGGFAGSGLRFAHPFVEESPRFLVFLKDELGSRDIDPEGLCYFGDRLSLFFHFFDQILPSLHKQMLTFVDIFVYFLWEEPELLCFFIALSILLLQKISALKIKGYWSSQKTFLFDLLPRNDADRSRGFEQSCVGTLFGILKPSRFVF